MRSSLTFHAMILATFLAVDTNALVAIPIDLFSGSTLADSLPEATEGASFERYDFTGIASLNGCSASLVRFEDSRDDQAALIMTNGHCVKLIPPGEVLMDEPRRRYVYLLGPDGKTAATLKSDRLVYATMTKTDLALYALAVSYEEIREKYAIEALTITREAPSLGMGIEIVSGYWQRVYECEIEATAFKLQEGDWTFEKSLRYSRPGCDVVGGTSGSPVIATGTRIVVAVNNTINESGRACEIGNPCEVNEQGDIYYEMGVGYAQQIHELYSCRTESGDFAFQDPSCLLPTGR